MVNRSLHHCTYKCYHSPPENKLTITEWYGFRLRISRYSKLSNCECLNFHVIQSLCNQYLQKATLFTFQFVAQTVTYPLSVVTTVTAMNRSGLQIGMLPRAPIYANWQDAYTHLKKTVFIRFRFVIQDFVHSFRNNWNAVQVYSIAPLSVMSAFQHQAHRYQMLNKLQLKSPVLNAMFFKLNS